MNIEWIIDAYKLLLLAITMPKNGKFFESEYIYRKSFDMEKILCLFDPCLMKYRVVMKWCALFSCIAHEQNSFIRSQSIWSNALTAAVILYTNILFVQANQCVCRNERKLLVRKSLFGICGHEGRSEDKIRPGNILTVSFLSSL